MKVFKNGDKVKIPTIGTASIPTKPEHIQEALADYKFDYLYVCEKWEDGDIAVIRGDGVNLPHDLYHERDLEHYGEYNPTFNPEAHSSLIIDFDAVETIEEFIDSQLDVYDKSDFRVIDKVEFAIKTAKSKASKNYWFKIFQEEQKPMYNT
jgi:hypothetical protein